MKTDNITLMKMARTSLDGKWGLAIGTCLVYLIITGAIQGVSPVSPLSGIITLIIAGPFALGLAIFSLSLSRNNDTKLSLIFEGFNNFGTALAAYLLIILYVVLWALLLIVPGIIAAISYSMTFYILADEPSMTAHAALDKSKKMMDGYKLKYFYLMLRFFLLALLCILTLGIGFLWLFPYMQITIAKFYDDLKQDGAEDAALLDKVS